MFFKLFATLALVTTLTLSSIAPAEYPTTPMRIGMVQTFFNDVPRPLVNLATDPFQVVMRQATGLQGHLIVNGDPFAVGKQLHDGNLQLAVFHGFEYAWLKEKYPALRPLMVAVNDTREVRAYLLTRKSDGITSFADLKGKDVGLPRRSKEQCKLFVNRACAVLGNCEPKDYFHELVVSAHDERALDDLYRGKLQGVVVDALGLEFYKDLKPGCFAKFQIAQESQNFPPPVIAYRDGGLDDATLARLRTGLTTAHNLALGREMMKLWKVHAFETIPDNFSADLAEVLKAYPSPEAVAKVSLR